MPIWETFTRRRDREARAGQPEVYNYDSLPGTLLGQIVLIWNDALILHHRYKLDDAGKYWYGGDELWTTIEQVFQREHGMLRWPGGYEHDEAAYRATDFFMNAANHDQRLDLIEIVMTFIHRTRTNSGNQQHLIDELNTRFRIAGVGYQCEDGKLFRMDSTVAHEEMVKPALRLLSGKGFEEADRQFRDAHTHYRRGEHPQAITEAGKAFESTLKAICTAKKWPYEKGARASDLIKVAVKNGLFPAWLEEGLTAYVAMMKTGLPGVRNEAGPHGTAPNAEPVRAYLARYALHMSASNILLVGEAAKFP
ncbi:MAG: hypothetical protein KIT25_06415 [Enhydrobacter sp.]|nr:MAG: hypothetical protein KIT25_06415 [Enhydrobacter sp.]